MGKPSLERYETLCVDCGVCHSACPNRVVHRKRDVFPRKNVTITVDDERFSVPERITIKRALELLGLEFGKFLGEAKIFAPCELGGCYACVLLVNGEPKPACVTPVRNGMSISLSLPEDFVPVRRVSGYQPHAVGGVGTPWWLKKKGGYRYVEVACFAHGCNLRCPQCQNYTVTYDNVTSTSTPLEAATILTAQRHHYSVNRMAVSGGEATLNRPWLTRFFRELRRLNPDSQARLHLDTNATILTPDYVDELIEAGVTDIGPDIKGLKTETFMRITGITNKRLAERYLRNEWEITKYMVDNYYPKRVFLGIGIPYNPELITLEEIREMGEKIASMNPEVQVCLLDYFPAFRRTDMNRPTVTEMKKAREALISAGLKTVLAQTAVGHIGP